MVYVCSLPFRFDYSSILDQLVHFNIKSTCPHEMNLQYDSVRSIKYNPALFGHHALSHIQLIDIGTLTLDLPIDRRFFSVIPRLDNLLYLNVDVPTATNHSQLQVLLDSAPRLYSLGFESWSTSTMPPYEYTSTSVRRLNLRGYNQSACEHICCNPEQCVELSHTPLAAQCKVLEIEIEEAEGIVILVDRMINLRTLSVWYEYDERSNAYDMVELSGVPE